MKTTRYKNRIEYAFTHEDDRDKKAAMLRARGFKVNCYNYAGLWIVDQYLTQGED